jgi:hypothetical protein
MDQQTISTGPGDYATAPATSHPHDPRNDIDGLTDLADQAHQRVVTKLIEGDTLCKVRIEDVFCGLIEKDRPRAIELLVRLCGLSHLSGDAAKNETDDIAKLAEQVLHDFVESNEHLRDSELDAMAEEARCEADA